MLTFSTSLLKLGEMMRNSLNYCSNCGAKLSFDFVEGENRKRYFCTNCGTIHYTNPKIIVGAVVYWEDKVLLCKRAIEPRLGFWNTPGGFLEDEEKAEDGAAREVLEESGGEVEIERVIDIYNLPHANQVYIHFLARLKDGKFSNGVESIESKLFTENEIPWKDMAFTSSMFALRKYFADRKEGCQKAYLGSFPQIK